MLGDKHKFCQVKALLPENEKKMAEEIRIHSLARLSQSRDMKVKAKRSSGQDKAGCQRLSPAPSTKHPLPVSLSRNSSGCSGNRMQLYTLMLMPSKEIKKWFQKKPFFIKKNNLQKRDFFGSLTRNSSKCTHFIKIPQSFIKLNFPNGDQ